MSKTYSPAQKAEALSLLEDAGANIKYISQKLKIPLRTLYAWRKESRLQAHLQQISTKNALAAEQKLQQLQQNSEVPPLQQSAFGMTRDELIRALEIEYIPSPYEDLRQALMLHINRLQVTISDDPDLAHVRALAVSRMIDDVMRLEPLCRLEKPQLNIIKYEYKDGSYHDIPEWSNRVYQRAEQAWNAVLRQARREYDTLMGKAHTETPPSTPVGQEFTEIEQPTLQELAQMHFTAEDFIPKPTGYLAWLEDRQPQPKNTNHADISYSTRTDTDESSN